MDDLNQSEALTEVMDSSSAKTQELRRPPVAKSDEDFQAGQSRVLAMVAANVPLPEILNALVLLIEAQSPDMLCSVLLLSDDGNHIRHGAAPSLPANYVKAIDGGPIGPKHGSCGTAMYRGEPVIVSDILKDPLWEDYRELAAASDLRACWSTPILSGRGKVLGSFAMYYRQPRRPTGDESSLTEVATRIAGLAIERQAAREALARTKNQLAQAANVSEAATSIAHELDQPLAAIADHADQCLELLSESDPNVGDLRKALTKIAADARHALEVVARIQVLEKE
jgi:GAF domain-containing protein